MSESSAVLGRIELAKLPDFLYGTAWKEERTRELTVAALKAGFRGIDTANQRKHYDEASVGLGIADAIQSQLVTREDLFLQTKFTFRPGQDHRLPYDPAAPVAEQVKQSFSSSLQHLGTTWIDSYVLHGPSQGAGLGKSDWEAWSAIESLYEQGLIRCLGISNVSLDQLQTLTARCRIAPHFVQNRCYATMGWDGRVRDFCRTNGIVYQGFSLLTANRPVLAHPQVLKIAQHYGRTPCQIVFRFARDVGMLPLTGTTSVDHMREDLEVLDFQLQPDELKLIERVAIA
ncbi:aldo/keto reductase family protein [Schlesneria sp.]|uniref:aldo/keto reductase family protein n=1 Tax=Schlesneria sp. TaxID=2762018 RepID=UPI002F0C52D6